MGLDLYCNGISVHVGSYSYVHKLRTDWIKASIEYIKDKKISNDLLDELNSWLLDNEHINYQNISEKPSKLLTKYGLQGLYYFVSHSDCGGHFNSRQSTQILKTLELIYNYLDDPDDNENVQDYYLYEILKYSADNKARIDFG
jgi:hypothetical protein